MNDGETLSTGSRTYRFCSTAHLPHGWDAGVLYEETNGTLFCSDLFTHFGEVEPLTGSDIVGRAKDSLLNMQQSPFAYYIPYTPQMNGIFRGWLHSTRKRWPSCTDRRSPAIAAGSYRAFVCYRRDARVKPLSASARLRVL
ncbi:MAG: hypothetical protein R3B51_14600 [Thermodesulfobacteriota bacterium]